MAYSISVSNITITPTNFTYGDTATITATITNTGSSGAVEGVAFFVYSSDNDELGSSGFGYNGTIAKNSSKTLTMQIKFDRPGARAVHDELIANGTRSISGLYLRAISTPKGSTRVINAYSDITSLFFDEHKGVDVTSLEVYRCNSNGVATNEGTYAAYTVQFTMPTGFTAALYYPTSSGYGNVPLAASVTGAIISGVQFATTQSYEFTLRITDYVERLVVTTLLPAAAANVHLSGHDTGGVALGRFSSATLGVPKFESNYQAMFYKGITGVNVYREAEVWTGGRWINNKPLYRRTYHIVRESGSSDIGPIDGDGFILVRKSNLPNYEFVHIIDAVSTYSYLSGGDYVAGYWSGAYGNGASATKLGHDNLRFYIHPGSGLKIQHGTYMLIDEVWVTIEYTVVGDTAVETDDNGNALGYSVAVIVPDDGSGSGSSGSDEEIVFPAEQSGQFESGVPNQWVEITTNEASGTIIPIFTNTGNYSINVLKMSEKDVDEDYIVWQTSPSLGSGESVEAPTLDNGINYFLVTSNMTTAGTEGYKVTYKANSGGGGTEPIEYFKEYTEYAAYDGETITLYASMSDYVPIFTLNSNFGETLYIRYRSGNDMLTVPLEAANDKKTHVGFVLEEGTTGNVFYFSNSGNINIEYLPKPELSRYYIDSTGVVILTESEPVTPTIYDPITINVTANNPSWVTLEPDRHQGYVECSNVSSSGSRSIVVAKASTYGDVSTIDNSSMVEIYPGNSSEIGLSESQDTYLVANSDGNATLYLDFDPYNT